MRALQTRQSKPMYSGGSGNGCAGLGSGGWVAAGLAGLGLVAVALAATSLFAGVGGAGGEIVNANEHAAQRARLPIIFIGTASFEPHPGQATTVVSDWVEAIDCFGLTVFRAVCFASAGREFLDECQYNRPIEYGKNRSPRLTSPPGTFRQ